MCFRKSLDDPSPQVLAWANAYVLVFSCADINTLHACALFYRKIVQYRAVVAPIFALGVQGVWCLHVVRG